MITSPRKRKYATRHGLTWLIMAELALCGSAQASLCNSCAYISGNNNVYAWDPAANTLTTVVTAPQGGLDSLVFDKDGNIIFDSGDQIYIYDSAAQTTSLLTTIASSPHLADMALEPSGGSILVAGRATKIIYRIDLTTKASSVFYSGLRPDGIIYDNTGKLFAVLNQSEVAQLDPVTGAVIKQLTGLDGADGLTFSTTTLKLYVGSNLNNGGFYTVPTDLSTQSFTSLNQVIDGVGTACHFLYLIHWGDCASSGCGKAIQYDLTTNQIAVMSQPINQADDIAPLSGFGSQATPPAPSLTSLAPNTTLAGSPAFTLTVNGLNFVNGAIVTWNGANRTTAFVNATQLTAAVSAADVANPNTINVGVTNPDSQISGTLPFTMTSGGGANPTTIQFDPTTYSVSETAGVATITVTRTGDTTGTSTVQFATSDGLALAGKDYVATSGTLTFNPGDTSKTRDVPITNDQVADGAETVNLGLSHPIGATLGTSQAVLTINDQNPPPGTVATPTIAPNGGSFSDLVSVSIQTATPGATLRYTTDGTDPKSSATSALYSGSLTLSASATVKAEAFKANMNDSAVASAIFTFTSGGTSPTIVSGPSANPNPTYTTSTALNVLGNSSSSGGESVLTYTWMLAGTNPSTNVTFANNGTHAAANTTATFRGPGTYHIQARIRDTVTQLAADSNPLDVTVVRDAKRIVVGPQNQVYTIGQVQPLNISATITDQWGLEMTLNPTWRTSAGSLAMSGQSAAFSDADVNSRQATITASLVNAQNAALSDSAQVTIVVTGAGPGGDLSGAKAYPVPFKSNSGQPGITFANLAPGTRIRLFTLTGRIVQTLDSPNGSDVLWDVKNADVDRVASGVYFYIIEGAGQKKEGKLVVIQ